MGEYEETPIKKGKGTKRTAARYELNHIGTPTILWFLTKRHKTGLLTTWGIVMTSFVLVPTWPTMVTSLFSK